MQFIDTHSHLYLDQFENDIREVIERAEKANVGTVILPNIDSATIAPLHQLTNQFPENCLPLMGLHPTHVKEDYKEELQEIFAQFEKYDYKGVGEIGIDLYWDKSFLNRQQDAFEQQLMYAFEKELPVVIHARESFNEILDIVRGDRFKGLKGIFHAFTGDIGFAREIIDLGYLLGIGGIVTFKNSHLPEVIAAIDLNHLVLETDSPYLAPTPYRGKRNESSYVPIIADTIARIKNIGIDEVAESTTSNAKRLFGI